MLTLRSWRDPITGALSVVTNFYRFCDSRYPLPNFTVKLICVLANIRYLTQFRRNWLKYELERLYLFDSNFGVKILQSTRFYSYILKVS